MEARQGRDAAGGSMRSTTARPAISQVAGDAQTSKPNGQQGQDEHAQGIVDRLWMLSGRSGAFADARRHGARLGVAGTGFLRRDRRAPAAARFRGATAAAVECRRHRRRAAGAADRRWPPPARAGRGPAAAGALAGASGSEGARLAADRALHPARMADAVEHGELGQADRRDRRQPGRAPGARGAGRTATGAGRAGASAAPGLRALAAGLRAAPARRPGAGRAHRTAQAGNDRPPCPAGVRAGAVGAHPCQPACRPAARRLRTGQPPAAQPGLAGQQPAGRPRPARGTEPAPAGRRAAADRAPARGRDHAYRADREGLGRAASGRAAGTERGPRPAVHPLQRHPGGRADWPAAACRDSDLPVLNARLDEPPAVVTLD
ncbi:hypothetical protein G6F68_010198 [Rhizopus microsporus]|nr:hypothetical protein G6F68_010198 [Rhizopus microsporus]